MMETNTMRSKFDEAYRLIMESINKFDFLHNDKYGPENIIEVAKSDVYAYQISTEEELKMLEDFASRETDYKDDPKYNFLKNKNYINIINNFN